MFLKPKRVRKDGKTHTYWVLVESVRTPKGPRHRTVAYLGELKPSEQSGWARLGRSLSGATGATYPLFERDDPGEPVPATVEVDVRGVHVESTRGFGDVYLALTLWRMLKLDVLLNRLLPRGRETVPWSLVGAILTCARFCHPSSELHVAETWYRSTALDELLGVSVDDVGKDRLYRAHDQILPLKDEIERHLKEQFTTLFDATYDLLLYDVTSTYFEGEAPFNPQAQRGYSRDHRPDCKQVCIGLVVTREGLPVAYEVFAGNRNDVTTVQEIVQTIEAKHGQMNRIWVLDRGMVNEENLAYIRERGGSYIVGTPRPMLRDYEAELLTNQDWTTVRDGLEVKLVQGPDGQETFVICRSEDRRQKENAMHERFERRIEEGLASLARDWTGRRRNRIGRRSSGRSDACWDATHEPPASSTSTCSGSNGRAGPDSRRPGASTRSGGNGQRSAKAAICCAPTCPTGRPTSCGVTTFNSHKPRRRSAPTRTSSVCGPSGTGGRIAFTRTSCSRSSPTRCGRRLSSGWLGAPWAMLRAPCSRSWPASSSTRSSCRPPPAGVFSFAA